MHDMTAPVYFCSVEQGSYVVALITWKKVYQVTMVRNDASNSNLSNILANMD